MDRSERHHSTEREHFNANGTPKRAFPSRKAASLARRTMGMSHVNIFHCRCGQWHHGHRTPERNAPKRRRVKVVDRYAKRADIE